MNWKGRAATRRIRRPRQTHRRKRRRRRQLQQQKADSGVDAKVISAKLSEQEQSVELESLKSSSETIVAAVGNNDEDDDETGNVSMVETVAWVHVARSGAARQAQSSVDDVDVQRTSVYSTGREKASKKTG